MTTEVRSMTLPGERMTPPARPMRLPEDSMTTEVRSMTLPGEKKRLLRRSTALPGEKEPLLRRPRQPPQEKDNGRSPDVRPDEVVDTAVPRAGWNPKTTASGHRQDAADDGSDDRPGQVVLPGAARQQRSMPSPANGSTARVACFSPAYGRISVSPSSRSRASRRSPRQQAWLCCDELLAAGSHATPPRRWCLGIRHSSSAFSEWTIRGQIVVRLLSHQGTPREG
jgi:hypothetical protein